MIVKASKQDYPILLKIWESAVTATHDFLLEEDYEFYKSQLVECYFPEVDLYLYKNNEDVLGFLGVAKNKIEMLFINNLHRGRGIGRKLINYALNKLKCDKVDVNEQNQQALDFYKHLGFKQYAYTELDASGRPYPIIYMQI